LHEDVLFSLAMPNTRRHGTLAVADIAGEPKNSLASVIRMLFELGLRSFHTGVNEQ